VELYKSQIALAEEQEQWKGRYGKKMAAHVRTFHTEAEYNEWKEKLVTESAVPGTRPVLVESDASMDEIKLFTKEKLNQ
jgi:hypothetical protein